MSFNVSLDTSASALQALSQQPYSDPPAGHCLGIYASLDDPGCGTPVPGHPPIPHVDTSVVDEVALNPQPLPPREVTLSLVDSVVNEVALNPQPLPPKEATRQGVEVSAFSYGVESPRDKTGNDPVGRRMHEPLPPGWWADIVSIATGITR